MRLSRFALLVGLGLAPFSSLSDQGKTVKLTPQIVVDRLLAEGFEKKNIDLQRIIDSKAYYDAKGVFDFGFETKISYQQVNLEPLGPFENEKEEAYNFSTKLLKPLGWGSTASLEYSRDSLKRQLNPFLSSNNSLSTTTTDFIHLELQQNLLNNFAGGVYDRRLEIQELLETQRDQQLLEDTEKLIIEGLEQFWKTYVASENLKAAIETRDRYQRLVSTSKRKARLGFAAPGELARVEAEYEQKDQTVKEQSATYLTELDSLFLILGVPTPGFVEFDPGRENIPPLPPAKEFNVNSSRAWKIEKILHRSWEMNKKVVDSEQTPKLDLVGRLSYRGADQEASEAFSDLSGGNSPTYFVGLTFQTYLGSSSQKGARQKALAELQKSQLRMKRRHIELETLLKKAERKVSSLYQIALSSKSTVQKRNQALKQIEAAYTQGRLDVSHVIEAFNLLLNAKTRMTTSVGNYHIWRNSLASLRDELIQEFTGTRPAGEAPQ